MKRCSCYLLLVCVISSVTVGGALAEVPHLINYQGILTEIDGTPITGTHDLTFTVYPDSGFAAPAYWTEEHLGVEVEEGLYNVILGSISTIPDTLFNDEERWIGITVDSDPEMSPRMRLTAVPWAFRAAVADTALSGGFWSLEP